MSKEVRVHQIFLSIQGESTFSGLPCAFVRLAGCPLCCTYCDTRSACESAGSIMTVEQVLDKLDQLAKQPWTGLVCLTGGEPLAQQGARPLLEAAVDRGSEVILETSGAFDLKEVHPRVHVVMDVKCPGSGMADRFVADNVDLMLHRRGETKFVVTGRSDLDWAVDFCRAHHLLGRMDLLVSPAYNQVDPGQLADWLKDLGLPLRLQVQLHKLIWDPEEERR